MRDSGSWRGRNQDGASRSMSMKIHKPIHLLHQIHSLRSQLDPSSRIGGITLTEEHPWHKRKALSLSADCVLSSDMRQLGFPNKKSSRCDASPGSQFTRARLLTIHFI